MISLALIGKDISHSRSQEVYQKILGKKIHYQLIDCPNQKSIPRLPWLFTRFQGVSLTSPYKKHFLSKVKMYPGMGELGAINCLRKTESGFQGINTDYLALKDLIHNFEKKFGAFFYVILGDGVMSMITQKLLDVQKKKYVVFSRKETLEFESLDLSEYYTTISQKMVINTCSREFFFRGKIGLKDLFWDYNYKLSFHEDYKDSFGDRFFDGFSLLELQAKYALSFWDIN